MTDIPSILAAHYPFWEHLKADEQRAFVSCSMVRDYEKGGFVRSDCDECLGVLLVLSGELRIYIQSDEGREVTLFRVGPGELCTLSASCVMSEIISDVMWAISQILFSSFDKRLASYLEDERRRSGSTAITATHDQIAKNLGSAREVVSRMLKYFEKEGLVSLSRGTVTITDIPRLKALTA